LMMEAETADTCTYTRAEVQRLAKKVWISDDTYKKKLCCVTKLM
jgi:hypothetical protein